MCTCYESIDGRQHVGRREAKKLLGVVSNMAAARKSENGYSSYFVTFNFCIGNAKKEANKLPTILLLLWIKWINSVSRRLVRKPETIEMFVQSIKAGCC